MALKDLKRYESSKQVDELDMDGGEEFQFVCEGDQGHAQALGATTTDQFDRA